jgi:cobalt-zinc-cadmium efflux system outer membrane protein
MKPAVQKVRAALAEHGLERPVIELEVHARTSQQAAAALGEYAAASARVEIYEKQILPKSREVFNVNRTLFEQGQTDFLRILQSQRTLIDSDLGYLDAQEARWTAAATISGLLQHEQFP